MTTQAPIASDVTALVNRLRVRRKELESSIQRDQMELEKIDSSLASLYNLRNAEDPKRALKTRAIIMAYIATLNRGDPITVPDLIAFTEANYIWNSTARNRHMAFAACLSHMNTDRVRVMRREGKGRYYKA